MDEKKSWFWREIEEGYIHVRDRLQFELKSEFITKGGKKDSVFLQELYFFIPESLLINPQTYTREQFYLDEINFIRTKTPLLTLEEIIDLNNVDSPLFKIKSHLNSNYDKKLLSYELKMLANIFRSTFRVEVKGLINAVETVHTNNYDFHIANFCKNTHILKKEFRELKKEIEEKRPDVLDVAYHVEEYLGTVLDNYLAGTIDFLRHHGMQKGEESDQLLCDLILEEGIHPEMKGNEEKILQRMSFLNKYFYEVLYLKNVRVELKKKHGATIGMIAAGAAMFVYMILFVWKATTFGINSIPFVVFAVFFYILKDRIKEGLKELYHKNAYRWFPDYSTEILSHKGLSIGSLNESFLFVQSIPVDVESFRKADQDENMNVEMIIQYKKEIILNTEWPVQLNTLFRFNIHKFLEKAADSVQIRPKLDAETREILYETLPKVYYLTLLLKNSFEDRSEIKKFRISIHKQGIEKVQYLGSLIT